MEIKDQRLVEEHKQTYQLSLNALPKNGVDSAFVGTGGEWCKNATVKEAVVVQVVVTKEVVVVQVVVTVVVVTVEVGVGVVLEVLGVMVVGIGLNVGDVVMAKCW